MYLRVSMRTQYNIIVLFMTNETALFGFSCPFTKYRQFLEYVAVVCDECELIECTYHGKKGCYFSSALERGLKNMRIAVPLKLKVSRSLFSR